jgi:pentose-5-phosphate-3-epimerase
MVELAPSTLSADFVHLAEQVAAAGRVAAGMLTTDLR